MELDETLARVGSCSLAPGELEERLSWIRREILPHALGSEALAGGFTWEFAAAPGLAETLDRLVALETGCCGALVFARVPSAEPGRLRLEVRRR
ncbi:MAG TPA: hypothetical protein VMR50_14720 [Myxococcota bacterium]|nr:hypothetical protein [Myxococcota bacterium]